MGDGFACALMDAGVKCWGYNAGGELGLGDTHHRGMRVDEMGAALPYLQLKSGVVQAVTAGGSNACALGADGGVTCWGADYGAHPTRVPMPGSKSAVNLASGGAGQCAVLYDESVVCWRSKANATSAPAPSVVDVGGPVQTVHVGGDHSCVVLADGGVKCWGSNGSGELGNGSSEVRLRSDPAAMGNALPRVNLGTNRTARTIALGQGFSCALLDNAAVKCWGENSNGRLGREPFGPDGTPGRVGSKPTDMGDALPALDFGAGRRPTAIALGSHHGCVLLAQGEVACWGRGYGAKPVTVDVGRAQSVRALGASWESTCVLNLAGRMRCWGRNDAGQLGLGDTRDRATAADWGDALGYVDLGSEKPR